MDQYKELSTLLKEYCDVKDTQVFYKTYRVPGLTMRKLSVILMLMGKIIHEDLDRNIYVAILNGGFFKKNYAVTVLQLSEEKLEIAAYAHEGIINQHTSEGIINEIGKKIGSFEKSFKHRQI